MYDLIIKNGTIIDGIGKDRYAADIAVKDGKIAKLEKLLNMQIKKLMLKVNLTTWMG